MASGNPTLSQLIDDYIAWFVEWHHVVVGERSGSATPPARFLLWRDDAAKTLIGEQPAVERITTLHEQLHKLVKLVLIKKAAGEGIESKDDESISSKYIELMQELRRFERAFAAAASDLDPLTGLRTRLTLRQDLEREISRTSRSKRPFFVAVMDIDHFKKINDTYGHDNGDRVLMAVANQISRGLRGHDDAYRIGGEEFLICLKETDANGSQLVVERLRSSLEKTPITLADGRSIPVTASFGLKACTDTITPDDLIREADAALYKAKHQGRNRVIMAN